MSVPDDITLPVHYRGDTLADIVITYQSSDGQTVTPVDLTGASIRMQLRKKAGANIIHEWSTTAASIVITDAPNGVFTIAAGVLDVPAYAYRFDIEVTLADGTVATPVAGTLEVKEDITR